MIAVGLFAAGLVTSAALWSALGGEMRSSPVLDRQNYRGHHLPVAGGVVLVLAVVLVAAVAASIIRLGGLTEVEAARSGSLLGVAVLGFAFIGLFDDLVGAVHAKGFRGHLGALVHGRITSGLVKLVWGVLLGILAVDAAWWDSIRSGVLIAATANLANLFDRAPGRVIKVGLLGGAVLVLVGATAWELAGPLLVLGAAAGLLVADLRERCMLGDTGANVIGAAVGSGLAISLSGVGAWVALAVVVGANLLSELVSFSRVIDRVPPLRWFDRLGALPERRAWASPATTR